MVDQGQINVKSAVGYEISKEDLEISTKNKTIMPTLVDSDEEMSSDENETESEIEIQNDLNQICVNKSNEALYSINIYITDIRIQTEIKNILNYHNIIDQDNEIINKAHVNLVKFSTNTNKKSNLFKALKNGIEEVISFLTW